MNMWNQLLKFKDFIIEHMNDIGENYIEPEMEEFNQKDWINLTWKTKDFRRCHLDVVDVRKSKKLWMMHFCIFPILNNTSPIYGFDVIAGEKLLTGAFHDFSPIIKKHEMNSYFDKKMKKFIPKKKRELPQWAKNIFSDSMLAASNVKDEHELKEILKISKDNLIFYTNNINKYSFFDNDINIIKERQNYYCENQKQNPHTSRVMKSLGLNDEKVNKFCSKLLFPLI